MNPIEQRRRLALHLLLSETIGPSGGAKILRTFSHAKSYSDFDLHHPSIKRWSGHLLQLKRSFQNGELLEKKIELWNRRGIQTLLPEESAFPPLLRDSPYCPALLFISGHLSEQDTRSISVVGTRQNTSYGERACRRLLGELTPYAPTIVSGMARGIDRAAHREAIRLQMRTIAVLGQGLLVPLDFEGRKMAGQICENGAVLSPFPPDWSAKEWTFPFRNRIISGMVQGTMVIESGYRGGALITARLAMEEGREVLAVPGPIDSERSAGCNQLIADGAHPALDGASIATLLRWRELPCAPPKENLPELTPLEEKIYLICPHEATSVDSVLRQLSLEVSQALAILATLEIKGVIRLLPGNRVERER